MSDLAILAELSTVPPTVPAASFILPNAAFPKEDKEDLFRRCFLSSASKSAVPSPDLPFNVSSSESNAFAFVGKPPVISSSSNPSSASSNAAFSSPFLASIRSIAPVISSFNLFNCLEYSGIEGTVSPIPPFPIAKGFPCVGSYPLTFLMLTACSNFSKTCSRFATFFSKFSIPTATFASNTLSFEKIVWKYSNRRASLRYSRGICSTYAV
mmetsp:Transcript_26584/g.39382  ORF Transcript_26584/g.39382 Transcript_26584/m.39382 type:complete len:211 (+) Transcript_26584:2194-2826(+)